MDSIINLPSGIRTRVVDRGAGPAVLLLHGNPDNADEWSAVIEALQQSHRCVAPDLPGYGRRDGTVPLPRGWNYSRERQIEFVDQLLDAMRIENVLLVVHDIGGIMGVPWAAANTDRVRAVLYTNTVAFPDWEWFATARQLGDDSFLGRVRARLMVAALGVRGGRLFKERFGEINPQLGAEHLGRFTRDFATNPVAKSTTVRQFRHLVRRGYFDRYDDMLCAIASAVPTRAVWGLGDPYVPDERAEQLFAARVVRLPDVGHWVPLLAADTLAAQVTELEALHRSVVDHGCAHEGVPRSEMC